MPRGVVERLDAGGLHDLTGVHHGTAVAELGDHRQVMRDEDQRKPEVAAECVEQLEDLRLHHHIQRRRRLVRDQDARIARQRHRDGRALAHPAGELMRKAFRPVARNPDLL